MDSCTTTSFLTRSAVEAAHEVIRDRVHCTPVMTCKTLDILASTAQTPESLVGTAYEGQAPAKPKIKFFFKCENYQRIGAFKIRGATHALSRLSKKDLSKGVVTHSSGNHAQALALAAREAGTTAHIVMPTISTPTKIAATQGYGARVYFSGSNSEEREAMVEDVIRDTGAILIPPYDHPDIILGQGTMALELESQVTEMISHDPDLSVHAPGSTPDTDKLAPPSRNTIDPPQPTHHHLDALLVPVGGGGMLSGIATALHGTPTRIYGAEPSFQGCDDGRRGLLSTPPTRIPHVSTLTIADGLRTPVGHIPWSIISDRIYVEGIHAVTESQITAAMRLVLERMKIVVEPSAVVGLAVALYDEEWRRVVEREGGEEGWDVGVVLSGGNTSVEAIGELFAAAEGRAETETELGKVGGERAEGKVGLDGSRQAEDVAG